MAPEDPSLPEFALSNSRKRSLLCLSRSRNSSDFEIETLSCLDIKRLASRLDFSKLLLLKSYIDSRITYDVLLNLPLHVLSIVLQQIDTETLLMLASLNSSWAFILVGRFSPSKHYSRNPSDFIWYKIFGHNRHQISHAVVDRPSSFDAAFYRNALIRNQQLEAKWAQFTNSSFYISLGASQSVITGVKFDKYVQGRFLSTSDDSSVMIWDLSPESLSIVPKMTLRGHQGGIWALAISRSHIISGSTDRTLCVWRKDTGERVHQLLGHTSTVRCIECVGRLIISGSRDCTLRVWDIESGRCLSILRGHTASVRCLSLINSNYCVSGSYDNTLRMWDLEDGVCSSTFKGHSGKVYSIAVYNPTRSSEYKTLDERVLIFSGSMDSTIRVWQASSGSCIKIITGFKSLVGLLEIQQICGRAVLVAAATDGMIQVWDVSTLSMMASVPTAHPNSITCLSVNSFSLITGSEGSIKLWDLRSLVKNGAIDSSCYGRLLDIKVNTVWNVALNDRFAVALYQYNGSTVIHAFDFMPKSIY